MKALACALLALFTFAPAQDAQPKAKFAGRKLGPGRGAGATQASEFAVLKGLRWLARHQGADGSWTPAAVHAACDPQRACPGPAASALQNHDVGLSSLGLLAFLGAGYSPSSKQDVLDKVRGRRHQIGELVGKAAAWLLARQRPDGSFADSGSFLFDDACATLALAELYGITGDAAFQAPAQKAIAHLESAQLANPAGEGKWGWGMGPGAQADLAASTWAGLALYAARIGKLEVQPGSFAGALAYATEAAKGSGPAGLKPAGPPEPHPGRPAAMDACLRIFCGAGPADPFHASARKRMLGDLPALGADAHDVDFEYWHFAELALWQLDSPARGAGDAKAWEKWNSALASTLIAAQDKDETCCQMGGWILPSRGSDDGGALFSTALNVLTLESYYRYANVFEPPAPPQKPK